METWKDIAGYDGKYQVSDLGNVRSVDHTTPCQRDGQTYISARKGNILKPLTRQHGYLCVQLYDRSQSSHARGIKTVSIHRLVAEAFIDNPNCLPEVNHKNEDKTDNRASNLEYVSHIQNSSYGTRGKRISASNTNGKRSKEIMQFSLSGELLATYPSLCEVRRQFGYATGNISKCARGDANYSHAYGYVWKYK